jgi:cytochrome c
MNRPVVCVALAALIVLGVAHGAQAATQAEAKDLVEKAAAYWKANGQEKTIAEINNPRGQFTKTDLYVFAHQINGLVLANGGNPKAVGMNYLEFPDVLGKLFVKECGELAKTKGSGWVDFLWVNPATKKIQSRALCIRRIEGTNVYVGSGVWK